VTASFLSICSIADDKMGWQRIIADKISTICSECKEEQYRQQPDSLLKGLDFGFCSKGHLWIWTDTRDDSDVNPWYGTKQSSPNLVGELNV